MRATVIWAMVQCISNNFFNRKIERISYLGEQSDEEDLFKKISWLGGFSHRQFRYAKKFVKGVYDGRLSLTKIIGKDAKKGGFYEWF